MYIVFLYVTKVCYSSPLCATERLRINQWKQPRVLTYCNGRMFCVYLAYEMVITKASHMQALCIASFPGSPLAPTTTTTTTKETEGVSLVPIRTDITGKCRYPCCLPGSYTHSQTHTHLFQYLLHVSLAVNIRRSQCLSLLLRPLVARLKCCDVIHRHLLEQQSPVVRPITILHDQAAKEMCICTLNPTTKCNKKSQKPYYSSHNIMVEK